MLVTAKTLLYDLNKHNTKIQKVFYLEISTYVHAIDALFNTHLPHFATLYYQFLASPHNFQTFYIENNIDSISSNKIACVIG